MSRRRIPENVRWQIIGMHRVGMSCRNIGVNLDTTHTVISRHVRKHADTGHVKDSSRQGRPRKTTPIDDRALVRLARRTYDHSSIPAVQLGSRRTSVQQHHQEETTGCWSEGRRPTRRPLLTDRHKQARLVWSGARRNWNHRTWRWIHWSDESRFLLHMTDGCLRVWRRPNEAYNQQMIYATEPFGGGSEMV